MINGAKALVLGVAAVVAFSSYANATTVRLCDVAVVQTNGTPDADSLACAGIFRENGQPSGADILAALNSAAGVASIAGPLTWQSLGKTDISGGLLVTQPGYTVLNDGEDGTGIGETSGTWSITNPMANVVYGILMKGSGDWGVWLLTTPGYSGTWDITDQILTSNNRNTAGLSNFTVYFADRGTPPPPPPPPTNPIPLPAAGWMLLAGVGGLAAWGRRRRNAA